MFARVPAGHSVKLRLLIRVKGSDHVTAGFDTLHDVVERWVGDVLGEKETGKVTIAVLLIKDHSFLQWLTEGR